MSARNNSGEPKWVPSTVEITVNLFFFSFVKMTEQHVLTQLKLIFYKHYAGKVKNKEMF